MLDLARMTALSADWSRRAAGDEQRINDAAGRGDLPNADLFAGRAEAFRTCARDLDRIITPLAIAARTQPAEGRRIAWCQGQSGNLLGYVGTLPSWAFQIFATGLPGGYKLIAQLPGLQGMAKDGAVDELQETAEQWLTGFTAAIGAAFTERATAGAGV